MAIIGAALITAGAAAYGANKSAKAQKNAAKAQAAAANAPWNNTSTTTSTQTPYGQSGDHLNYALQQAQALYNAGPPKGKKGGVLGANAKGASTKTTGIADQIINAGGATPANQKQADNFIKRTLSNPMGSNAIRADLVRRLGGADFDRGSNLLGDFLGLDEDGGYGAGGGAGQAGGGGQDYVAPQTVYRGSGAAGSTNGSGGGAGGLVDSHTGGWADQQMDWFFDDARMNPMDDPSMQAYLDQIQRESQEDLDHQLGQIGDEFDDRGMYGSSLRALENVRTREELGEAREQAITGAMMDQRNRMLGSRVDLLGLQGQRDIAATNDRTNNRQIDAQSAASAAALGAGAADREASMGLARRGQDLDAIRLMMSHDEYGLNQLGDLSGDLSADQFSALGAMPAINDIRFRNLGAALGASTGIDNMNNQAAARNAQARQQAANAPGQLLDDYMRRIALVGGMGGTSTSTTTASGQGGQVSPAAFYSGPSANDAGWAAGIGALAQGLSAWGQNRQPAQTSARY